MTDDIRAYWDERAASAGPGTRTTDDVWLRVLERRVLHDRLGVLGDADVVDVGCGDGATVLSLAASHPDARFVGVDFSPAMVAVATAARDAAPQDVRSRVTFLEGDATVIDDVVGTGRFDVVTTDRCLINLPSQDDQYRALAALARCLRRPGRYLGIENFLDGHEAMNAARAAVGVSPIEIRWHNRFFDEDRFLAEASSSFDDVEIVDFSSTYYLVTRVAYSALCATEGRTPDYDHPLHRIAVDMPAVGRFSPIRLVDARRSATP